MERILRGLFAVVLAATLTLAYVPIAHADLDHADSSTETGLAAGGHSHGAAHDSGAASDAHQASSGPDQLPCCDATGVCAPGFAFSIDGSTLELAQGRDSDWSAGNIALTDFDPGLDLPPPRHS